MNLRTSGARSLRIDQHQKGEERFKATLDPYKDNSPDADVCLAPEVSFHFCALDAYQTRFPKSFSLLAEPLLLVACRLVPWVAKMEHARKAPTDTIASTRLWPLDRPQFKLVALLLPAMTILVEAASAQVANVQAQSDISARKIFIMLFLMLGPVKILVPFVKMTKGTDPGFRRRLATRSIVFSAAALALAGLLGSSMMENFNISLPVLALTGGVVLFLVALQTVLHQSLASNIDFNQNENPPGLDVAFNPLAFPIIVTPYGIAAVIIFATLARGNHVAELTLSGIVLAMLAMDWLAMLFAEVILKGVGTVLQVFAVVLGVAQIALGLQIIFHSLGMIGVFVERAH